MLAGAGEAVSRPDRKGEAAGLWNKRSASAAEALMNDAGERRQAVDVRSHGTGTAWKNLWRQQRDHHRCR